MLTCSEAHAQGVHVCAEHVPYWKTVCHIFWEVADVWQARARQQLDDNNVSCVLTQGGTGCF